MCILIGLNLNNDLIHEVNYTTFLSAIHKHEVRKARIYGKYIYFVNFMHKKYSTYMPFYDHQLLHKLLLNHVIIVGMPPQKSNILFSMLVSWFPTFLLIGVWFYFMRQVKNNVGRNSTSFGKSKTRIFSEKKIKVTFKDVAGCDEAKEEVRELVDYLKTPKKFKKLGGKIPKGVLMIGPPGTGKTLLAKAIAGEAGVSFITLSGSDFVEMFVGVGAARVRDVFHYARKKSPCIIFIDEIDAVGRHRGSMFGGGNDEREQTLNQILVEMDGFEGNPGIILIAATNRPDVLDPALLRPGRFDRQVVVSLPDVQGRNQILKVHMKNVPISSDVNTMIIARGTPGFSGADLSNLVNESVLFAARANQKEVSMLDFEKAKDKIMIGSERRSMIMTEQQKECTAYHESGHVIVGQLVPNHDPVHKVTIVPRGRALGVTLFLPESDVINLSKEALESQISTLYGGRLAEEIIYGASKVSTGAMNDIKVATNLARNMVTKWGFSDKLGPLLYETNQEDGSSFTHSLSTNSHISEFTASLIDKEIKSLIEKNYCRAKKILKDNINILYAMKDALIKYETINASQIHDLMNGKIL
ncbi:ATP-dependent zinc metalloprotease FtsH [Buchnera aphidicola (Shivaphis celti)]